MATAYRMNLGESFLLYYGITLPTLGLTQVSEGGKGSKGSQVCDGNYSSQSSLPPPTHPKKLRSLLFSCAATQWGKIERVCQCLGLTLRVPKEAFRIEEPANEPISYSSAATLVLVPGNVSRRALTHL